MIQVDTVQRGSLHTRMDETCEHQEQFRLRVRVVVLTFSFYDWTCSRRVYDWSPARCWRHPVLLEHMPSPATLLLLLRIISLLFDQICHQIVVMLFMLFTRGKLVWP